MSYRIRLAKIQDIQALSALESSLFPSDRLSPRQMRYHLTNRNALFLVCVDSQTDGVLGYGLVLYHKLRPPRLYSIAVAQDAQGRGIGKALLDMLMRKAMGKKNQAMTLEVRAQDKKTIKFYERHGFQAYCTIESYYEDGADALKMKRF